MIIRVACRRAANLLAHYLNAGLAMLEVGRVAEVGRPGIAYTIYPKEHAMYFVFDHIPKCGGTTVWNMFHRAGCPVLRFNIVGARTYEGEPGKLLICGHELFHNLQKPDDESVLYFVVLRDPIEVFYDQFLANIADWGDGELPDAGKDVIDWGWAAGLKRVREKFGIDPARYDFVGALEKLEATAAKLSELTGLKLQHKLHMQKSTRPVVDYRRRELEQVLAPEIELWKTTCDSL